MAGPTLGIFSRPALQTQSQEVSPPTSGLFGGAAISSQSQHVNRVVQQTLAAGPRRVSYAQPAHSASHAASLYAGVKSQKLKRVGS